MTLQGLLWNFRGLKNKGGSTFQKKNLIQQYGFRFIGL